MNYRISGLIGFGVSVGLIAIALYFQYVDGLEPCPLCIFQRIAFIVMGILFLIFALHNPGPIVRRLYGSVISIVGILGAAIAARHIWLQNLSGDQVPECGPGLSFMLEAFPFYKMLQTVLRGSGECAEVSWTFWGLSMPGWSLVWLILLTWLGLWLLFSRTKVSMRTTFTCPFLSR